MCNILRFKLISFEGQFDMHLSHIRIYKLKRHFRGGLNLNCYQVTDVT